MPTKPAKPRSGPSWADFDFDPRKLDERYPLALPPERGARPGKPVDVTTPERGDPRNSRTPPMVDWTEEDDRALDNARRHNPGHSGRGVPPAGRGFKVPPPLRKPWRNLNPLGGPAGTLVDILDGIDDWANQPVPWRPSSGFGPYMTLKCSVSTLPSNYPRVTHRGTRSGNVNATDCGLSAQAWENAPCIDGVGTGITNGNRTFITLAKRSGDPAVCPATDLTMRFRYNQVWWLTLPAGVTIPAGTSVFSNMSSMPWGDPEADPNRRRSAPPGDRPPAEGGSPAPGAGSGTGGEPSTDPAMGLPGLDAAPDLGIGSQPWTQTQPGISVPPRGRSPEAPTGERERKFVTRTQRVGQALFQALDTVSEWAEIVDCIYGSLPKKTRDRWEKDRGMRWVKVPTMYKPEGQWMKTTTAGRRGLSVFETAGQYGLDGADWKSQAIWHNLGKVDMDAAFKCMAANHVEDMILGGIQRRLPRNTGGALDQGNQALAEALNWAQEALGV